jgi:hypothetical protein
MNPEALTDDLIALVEQLRGSEKPCELLEQIITKAHDLQGWIRRGCPPWEHD